MICVRHSLNLLDHTSRHCCRNSSEICSKYNQSIGMRSYLLKNSFKRSLQKHHFVYVYEVIIKYYLNFITCLYFHCPLIRWNSSHCHLMELFKSKESFKEKVDSTIIEKLHGLFRVTSIFKTTFRICMKNVEFCWKTSKFLLKRCLFIFCNFHSNEKEFLLLVLDTNICVIYL